MTEKRCRNIGYGCEEECLCYEELICDECDEVIEEGNEYSCGDGWVTVCGSCWEDCDEEKEE